MQEYRVGYAAGRNDERLGWLRVLNEKEGKTASDQELIALLSDAIVFVTGALEIMPPVNELLDLIARAQSLANSLRGRVSEADYVAEELDELLEFARDNCWAVDVSAGDLRELRGQIR
jgi:hypothetical protein